MTLDEAFEFYLPIIDEELRAPFETLAPALQPFYGMMGYHLGWLDESLSAVPAKSGKRLRPLLCLLACRAAGGNEMDAVPVAATLELIHNFSLVHDDIEDNSPTRRHRRTVWAVWGQPHAINLGDGLFALAFLNLSRLKASLPATRFRRIFESCARACLRLCEGQYMDMSFETRIEVAEDEYLQMISGKTAALLSCSCLVGALVGTDDPEVADRYGLFGEQLGLAFQIQDDILGIWGDPKVTGKPIGDDILHCKKTLPVLFALKRETELGGHKLAELYARGVVSEDQIPLALEEFNRLGALDYARKANWAYCDSALEQIKALSSETASHSVLVELVERLRERPS